jgi:hypothetical protein
MPAYVPLLLSVILLRTTSRGYSSTQLKVPASPAAAKVCRYDSLPKQRLNLRAASGDIRAQVEYTLVKELVFHLFLQGGVENL